MNPSLKHLTDLQALHQKILESKRQILATYSPKLGTGDPRLVGGIHEFKLSQMSLVTKERLAIQAEQRQMALKLL